MVNMNLVDYFTLNGNTYANLEALRKIGARFDNGGKYWRLQINGHPLNNTKQRKKFQAMLDALEENGVRFTAWTLQGQVRK